MAPLVSLMTINFNGYEHLEPFFQSVFAQDFPADQLEVLMVDNGSVDGSLQMVREKFPQVRIVENGANLGFAKANNIGAAAATGRYLALLNNDMRLEPDWVTKMMVAMKKAPSSTACIGSRILNWDGSAVDFIASGMAVNGMGFQLDYGAGVDSPAGRNYPSELLFACGGAMLVDREVYLAAGGLDEDYFAYYEDVDFGWRLWVLGYRVGFCPEAVVYHRHNGTSSQFGQYKKNVLLERNSLYSVIKNYDETSLNTILPAVMLLSVKRMAVRSGIPRSDYAFVLPASPASAPAEAAAVAPEAGARKFLQVARHQGLKPAIKKALLKIADKIQRKWGPPAPPVALGDGRHAIHPEAYATIVGLEDLMDHLPRLLEKRREIQAGRKRSDAEIFKLFKLPYQAVEGQGDYIPVHERTLSAFGVNDYFEARLREDAPVTAAH